MEFAGGRHTVLLKSDGQAVACANDRSGPCNIPPLDEGIWYIQVSAGRLTVLLRSDGQAVACANDRSRECNIPPLHEGILYTQVSAGGDHSVLLRSDGQAVACGQDHFGQCWIPPLDEGIRYTQVSAGGSHTVLLRSDGQAVASGYDRFRQCTIPRLEEGLFYTQVSAGEDHTVLLRSDGQAVACGKDGFGQCRIPPLDEGIRYIQASAGGIHTVLLRSDDQAVFCGDDRFGQCDIPPLHEGTLYSQVSAGGTHTVLLRSDGQAVACGQNTDGQCDIPPIEPPDKYICSAEVAKDLVLQVDMEFQTDEDLVILTCFGLDGREVLCLKAKKSDTAVSTFKQMARELSSSVQNLRLILPNGQLFTSIWRTNPFATLSDVQKAWSANAKNFKPTFEIAHPLKQPYNLFSQPLFTQDFFATCDFHTHNQVDLISFSKRIKPTDLPWCTEMHQKSKLAKPGSPSLELPFPTVIFVFFNEAWRVRIRYS